MSRWRLAAFACLLALTTTEPRASRAAPGAIAPVGLVRVFEPGPILQDRNGDGQVDFVAVRIVIPDAPTPEETAAAASVAGRFGFESSGLSLPLVFRASEVKPDDRLPLVVIGASNPFVPQALGSRIRALEAGRGLVASLDGITVIAGPTPEGTRAAAESFASRSPYFWEVTGRGTGDTFERVANDVARVLQVAGATVRQVSIDEIVFDRNRSEAVSAVVSAMLARGTVARAQTEVDALKRRHLRGADADKLNYSSIAELALKLTDGQTSEVATISRVGLPGRLLAPAAGGRATSTRGSPRPKQFDLSDLYTPGGLLSDTDGDRIADQTDTLLVLPAERTSAAIPTRGAAHLAARLGLEATGVSFPLLKLDAEVEQPARERTLVLLGAQNRLAEQLRRTGRTSTSPPPGTGVVEIVPAAFGDTSAVVVSGGDGAGAEAAADYLARRAPYLWNARRGEPTLEDVENRVRALLDGRTAAGHAALTISQLDRMLAAVEGQEFDSIEVRAYLETRSTGFEKFLTDTIRRRVKAERVAVSTAGLRDPVVVFEEKPVLEWEVDRFWRTFRERAVPHLKPGAKIAVDLRVSESQQVRQELTEKIRAEITRAGAVPQDVSVICAYKQGLSWLQDAVMPALKGKPVAQIEVGWQTKEVDTSKRWVFHDEPARWLSELYPADEVLARGLSIPLSAISFVRRDSAGAIYQVTATDRSGRVLLRDSFSPASYERPWFDAFPDKARVTVTTGWVSVKADAETLLDERLPTDPDVVWDYYQGTILKKIADHIRTTTGGKPTQDKQPFFHTLRFELNASEPDYRLGIDEELISSLESIHDSVYYDGLDFFNYLIEAAQVEPPSQRSGAPGNILPWIHPDRPGQAPELIVTYSDNASREPRLVVTYRTKTGDSRTETTRFAPVRLPAPTSQFVEVESGRQGLRRVGVRVAVETTEPLLRLADLLDNTARLQRAGLFTDELGFPGVAEIAVRVEAPNAVLVRSYTSKPPPGAATLAQPFKPGHRLVGWEHSIGPEESERIAHTLGTLPGVTTYVAGRSYQGRPVSVMELTLPQEAELVSRAKLITWKPVLSIIARQHANEVSSTSHVLRLAELLATDPAYRRYLKRLNVVIEPVSNPDGAALASELHKLTPYHCVHAGRYSALGSDVPNERGNPYTLVTEALVLDKVFSEWLPDVQLNPHGYATHEQVQMFANYKRFRFRSYWIPRGWYTSVQIPEDPRYAEQRAVAFAMRDYVAEEVSSDPQVRATNLRIYDRYRRWTIGWQPHAYDLEVYRDTAIYFSRRGSTADRPGENAATTVFSAGTEAMDEPADGEWLDLVSRMGFGFLKASLRFIDEADYRLYRLEEERQGRVTLSVTRPRPLKPGRRAKAPPSGAN